MWRSLTGATALLAVLGGCAGSQAGRRADDGQVARSVAELRAQARRDRRMIEDLENQIAVLKDQLETARVTRDRAPGRQVALPVVVVEPAPALAAEPAAPASTIWGDGDVEIVYEGEAARSESVRPRIQLVEEERAPVAQPAPAPLPPLPVAGERLPVTRGVPRLSEANGAAPPLPPPAASLPPRARDPQAEYRRYYEALKARNHAYAIAGLRGFLERYPRHDYADNAQYWLGEAFYDQQDFRAAVAEFRLVVERYPDGNKVPDALLKIGYSHARLGETGPAREVLRQLLEVHPKSNAAALAARRLEELDGSQGD